MLIIFVYIYLYYLSFTSEYVPTDDEIALHIKLNTDEDISKSLKTTNSQSNKRKFLFWFLVTICIILIITFIGIMILGNTYMDWNYKNPETAILGFSVHSFIWLYVRIAPVV